MKLTFNRCLAVLVALLTAIAAQAVDITIPVQGLQAGDSAYVTLESSSYLSTVKVLPGAATATFSGVEEGSYSAKVEASGYDLPPAMKVVVAADGGISPVTGISFTVTKKSEEADTWSHSWQQDESTSGHTETSHINTPPAIEFLGEQIVPADVPYASRLYNDYGILLSDEGKPWTQEYAYRLLETMKTIWNYTMSDNPAKFILTSDHLDRDLTVEKNGDSRTVTISEDAFFYANPFLVTLDGVRGKFYSKRLHHAMVNFATDMGENEFQCDQILEKRFGCKFTCADYAALTAGITDEDGSSFMPFKPSERVAIINMLEELPEGFHKTPHLKYLIRRTTGMNHPLYPTSAAVSWCVDNGYIEFMDATFSGNDVSFDTQRLILHEKTHFLWAFTFSDEIKTAWEETGGWYEDPNSESGWKTTKEVEFVSAYSHGINPDEDMAESVAFYLKNPELLTARANEKYEFIRDRIMHGVRYVSMIPDHLTFEVLNLFPDYSFPGKVKRIDVTSKGAPDEDKTIDIEVELYDVEGYEDGANSIYTRIESPKFTDSAGNTQRQLAEIWMNQVDGNDHVFHGTYTLSKYAKTGYWSPTQFDIVNKNEVERHVNNEDFALTLYVNNPLEDITTPEIEKGSLQYVLTDTVIDGHNTQRLIVKCKVTEENEMRRYCIRLINDSPNSTYQDYVCTDDYRFRGDLNETITIPDYFPSARYAVKMVELQDIAGNTLKYLYGDAPSDQEPLKWIDIHTDHPDTVAPEIDLNRITVYAQPTHPEAPDGETNVTINFYDRDDISGVEIGRYTLRDPQGTDHADWMYIGERSKLYIDGDPTAWTRKKVDIILPQGSVPGIWGVSELQIQDKAHNIRNYNFVETVIFDPNYDSKDFVLYTEWKDETLALSMSATDPLAVKYGWRVINEETGVEIKGGDAVESPSTRAADGAGYYAEVDLTGQPAGDYIVIATAMDADGKALSVKSVRVSKGATSVNSLSEDGTLTVTPGHGTLTIISGKALLLPIYDMSGRTVAHVMKKEGTTTINIPAGIYIVAGGKYLVK